jgi:glucose/arabinose dehydrogenase
MPAGLTGSVAGTAATLRWSASTDNFAVSAHDVYRDDAKVGSTSNLSYTDSGLAANTTYRYAVAARDAQGNVSQRTTSVSLTTGSSCSNPVCSVSQVTTDTDIPWGLVALPDGSVLYSRRDAQDIVRLNPATGAKTTVGKIPNVSGTDGEGGLMGLAVTPAFPATDPWLYVMHTTATDNRVVRLKYVNGTLDTSTLQVLLSGILRNKYHNGGRLRFGPDGKLYVATGDAQNGANAQNTSGLNGKVLRLNPDGTRPTDNPFGNYVWSYGHRNPQGLAFDAQGRLWQQEFGDSTMDETNLIQKGGNYGWPDCEGTLSRSGSGCATSGYIAPKRTYPTADGSCSGIAIVRGVLYVACQRGTRVYREVISGDSLTNVQELFRGTYGRIRTVEPSVDGNLWMSTTNNGDKDSTANNSDEKVFKVILGN